MVKNSHTQSMNLPFENKCKPSASKCTDSEWFAVVHKVLTFNKIKFIYYYSNHISFVTVYSFKCIRIPVRSSNILKPIANELRKM